MQKNNRVHVTVNGRESVFEIIMENGEVAEINIRKADNKVPLRTSEQATAEEFVRKYAKNIIAKWVNFFVMKKTVKNTVIRKRI